MAILKKTAAFFTAVMIAACVAGCADTSYAMKADNEEIKAGIYIDYIYNEMSTQMQNLYQSGVTTDFLTQKIDGKNFTEYVAENALKSTKEHVAINKKFDELKLTVDEETLKSINSKVSDDWEQLSEQYEKQGISRESFKEVYLNSAKRKAIFDYYYAKDGVEAVPQDELVTYVKDNYLRYKMLSFPKNANDETADKESKDLRDKYLKQAKDLSFEEFDTVIEAYNQYQAEKNAASSGNNASLLDSAASAEASTVDSSVAETESAKSTDSSKTTDTLSSYAAEGDEESATDVSAYKDASGSADDSSEPDPYVNESMTNYGMLDEESLATDSGKVISAVKDLEIGKATAYDDNNYYYILIKGDIAERSKEFAADEKNTDALLTQMKAEDFQKKIDEWVKKISFDINDEAIDLYTVQKVYDIQNEKD